MNALVESLNLQRETRPLACSIEYSIANKDVLMCFLKSFVSSVKILRECDE